MSVSLRLAISLNAWGGGQCGAGCHSLDGRAWEQAGIPGGRERGLGCGGAPAGETWRREEGIKLQTGGHREQGKTVQKGAEEQDRSWPSRAANEHWAKGNKTLLMGEHAQSGWRASHTSGRVSLRGVEGEMGRRTRSALPCSE